MLDKNVKFRFVKCRKTNSTMQICPPKRFYLNGHTIGSHPQSQKLEPFFHYTRLRDSLRGTQRPNVSKYAKMVFSMLQKPVWLIWSCPKNYLSVRMSQRNFVRHESFRWLFRFIRKCQLPLCVWSKVRRHEVALLSSENYRGRFVFIPKVLGDLFLTIVAISWY